MGGGGRSDLADRTRAFALRILRLGEALPRTRSANVIAYQVIKSGTSVGAHYCEGMRSRSAAEAISKLEGALMELEETTYWMHLLVDMNVVAASKLESLRNEANELTAILVTCVKNIKQHRR